MGAKDEFMNDTAKALTTRVYAGFVIFVVGVLGRWSTPKFPCLDQVSGTFSWGEFFRGLPKS